jgi:hypothetical protein
MIQSSEVSFISRSRAWSQRVRLLFGDDLGRRERRLVGHLAVRVDGDAQIGPGVSVCS